MVITKEQVENLPIIPIEEFNNRLKDLKSQNWIVEKLDNEIGWENMAPHLIRDLFHKIGGKPAINKY